MIDKTLNWVDDRLGVAKGGRTFLDKIFPDHWSFMLGEICLYSFVVLLGTGVFLTLYYVPSAHEIVYHGSYVPLQGQHVSEAYASTVGLSFDVRSGLLMRQAHHWAADIFLGAIAVHMARVFFTGAFRKPRELNWIVGVTMLILGIVNGFLGYSLPDDLVSGTGIRIAYSIIESIPLVGSYVAFFLFGGNYPGNGVIIPRFFIIHVLIVPAIIAGLLAAHLGLLVKQKHTQFAGKGKTEKNVVGSPMFPTFMAKTTGFLFMTTTSAPIEVPQTISGSMPASVNASMIPMCDHPRAAPLPSARPIRERVMAIPQSNAAPGASNSLRQASLNSRSGSNASSRCSISRSSGNVFFGAA